MIERVRASRVLLWIGGCLLAILVVTAVLGPYVAPYSPSYQKLLRFEGGKPVTSPEPPSAEHWLGKDQRGRDVLTLMLYGLKYTLFFVLLVSLFRVVLGGIIGVWSGMRNDPSEKQETPEPKQKSLLSLSGLFGGIPAIFLLVYLLEPIISSLSFGMNILVQGTIIAAFGVAPVASAVAEQTRNLKNRLFVLAARTMGATRGWMIRRHILPMLKEKLVILFVQDMILVLNTLGQLSVFNIFLGGMEKDEIFLGGPHYYFSKSFEWVGLIGQNKTWEIVYPYLVWVPLAAYFILLLSFFLVAKGLEIQWREMYNKHPHV